MRTADRAHAAALAGLSGMTPKRLRSLLGRLSPIAAWSAATGDIGDPIVESWFLRSPQLRDQFRRSGDARPPDEVWEACVLSATRVVLLGDDDYPAALAADPQAPAVVFARGSLDTLRNRRAGVVGTRNATEGGRRVANRLGRELAEAGVAVVSGLARGIDGATHRGALAAVPGAGGPVAVVASGPDHPFPREHRELWAEVVERGVVLSEHPPGSPPLPERFLLRNRILAALSEVLVVVESRERGGSLVTARLALERNIPVLAVPGSLHNRAADGTNRLIADGAHAALDTLDVLVALGLETSRAVGRRPPDPRRRPSPSDREVLDAFAGDPLTLDQLILRCGRSIAETALAVGRLEADGWLADTGGWFEPVGAPGRG